MKQEDVSPFVKSLRDTFTALEVRIVILGPLLLDCYESCVCT